jgi:hypothetical protein
MERVSSTAAIISDAALVNLPGTNRTQQEEVVQSPLEVIQGGAEEQKPSVTCINPGTAATQSRPTQIASNVESQGDVPSGGGEARAAAASKATSSAKRKVAMYVAYIGAGYSVSPLYLHLLNVSQH